MNRIIRWLTAWLLHRLTPQIGDVLRYGAKDYTLLGAEGDTLLWRFCGQRAHGTGRPVELRSKKGDAAGCADGRWRIAGRRDP